jgi:hypothetical protein
MYLYNFQSSNTQEYIISRDGTGSNKNIGIYIDKMSPSLTIEYSATQSGGTSAKKTVVVTDNFPLQTWAHVIVSVDNSYIDVYLNGKLLKSIYDASIDTPSQTSPIKYGKVNCNLAKLSRTVLPTDPQTAWDKYSAGNGENPMAKYLSSFGLTMSLNKNNQEYSKITVF